MSDGPRDVAGECDAGENPHADGVVDDGETDPLNPVTDNGLVVDGTEVLVDGTDHLDPSDDTVDRSARDRPVATEEGAEMSGNGIRITGGSCLWRSGRGSADWMTFGRVLGALFGVHRLRWLRVPARWTTPNARSATGRDARRYRPAVDRSGPIGFDRRVDNPEKPSAPLAPYEIGDLIDGKYRVQGVLGEGSFGWVFMAAHARIQALTYAVKVLKAEHTSDSETVARFHREAETVASLQSKHSVRVTDYGVDGELPYIVMEFVNGLSIGEMLARGGPFLEVDVLELSLDVLRALDEAHRLGIVHRDLKPDNIIVVPDPDTRRPVARVLDFGLAKILEPENFQVRPEATAAGLVLCTARYASPDLLKGSPSPQSDIYALGISMIEMLDGRPPYGGDDFYTVAAKHIDPTPVPMGAASSASVLALFIETCTEKKLELRYASAADAIEDLLDIQRRLIAAKGAAYRDTVSASVMARFGGPVPTRPLARRRRRQAGLGALAVALVSLLGVALAFFLNRTTEPAPESAPGAVSETPAVPTAPEEEEVSPELLGAAASAAEAMGRTSARETRWIAVEAAQASAARATAAAERSERRDDRRERADDEDRGEPADDSTSAAESDTDENLFGGIRTIGGQ